MIISVKFGNTYTAGKFIDFVKYMMAFNNMADDRELYQIIQIFIWMV